MGGGDDDGAVPKLVGVDLGQVPVDHGAEEPVKDEAQRAPLGPVGQPRVSRGIVLAIVPRPRRRSRKDLRQRWTSARAASPVIHLGIPRRGDPPVEVMASLAATGGCPRDPVVEDEVQVLALALQDARDDLDARLRAGPRSPARVVRGGIHGPGDHPLDSRGEDGLGAGPRPARRSSRAPGSRKGGSGPGARPSAPARCARRGGRRPRGGSPRPRPCRPRRGWRRPSGSGSSGPSRAGRGRARCIKPRPWSTRSWYLQGVAFTQART